jgi:NAD(P)H-hydrate epimerase
LANHSASVSICRSRAYHLPDEITFQRTVYQSSGGKEAQLGSLPVEPVDLIIDALIGCGLAGAPGGPTATLIGWANANGAPILSLDVPTGVDATTGFVPGDCIRPVATLALGLPKTGLLRDRVGQLYLADVGIGASTFAKVGIDYQSPFGDKFTVPLVIN